MPTTYGNFIDGEWTDCHSGETFDVTNPAATDEVVSVHQASSEEDVEAALDAAVAAQDEWASTPGPSRGAVLREAGNNLEARKEEATELLVREEGKTRSEAGGEVQRAIDIFHYYGAKARDVGGTVKSGSALNKDLYTKHEPLGTVALITPWNYPIAIPAWKIAPALAAGNTAVLKPASQAPGAASIVFDCLDDA
jgi:aldehyde dehydrogenase (NAD+)